MMILAGVMMYASLNAPYYFMKLRMFRLGYIDGVRNSGINSFDKQCICAGLFWVHI